MADVRYPKNWKEMSLDMRLMFVSHLHDGDDGCRRFFDCQTGAHIAGTIVGLIVLVSGYYRQKRHWRWPGVKTLNVLYAVGGTVLVSLFLYSAAPLFPPNNGHIVPWYLASVGIGLFGILQSLKVVYASEADFASYCMIIDQYGRELEPIRNSSVAYPYAANWKRVIKVIYSVTFVLVWLCSVASFYFFGTAFKNGSPVPTITQTEPLLDHGKTVHVTPIEKQRVHSLQLVSWVGFPVVLLGGAVLHFLVGVRLFPNTPTLAEYLNRGKNTPSAPIA